MSGKIPLQDFDIVFYHRGCPDGIAAALPFWLANRERFVPGLGSSGKRGFYGKGITHATVPEREWVEGRSVAFVDICLRYEEMEAVARAAKYLLIIDHHMGIDLDRLAKLPNCKVVFDTGLSAAQLAWDYTSGGKPRPWFIDIIGDGDLWRFALPDSRPLYKALSRQHKSWEAMEELLYLSAAETEKRRAQLIQDGQAVIEQERDPIEEHCKSAVACQARLPRSPRLCVLLTQCSAFELISDIGSQLATDTGVGATWYYNFTADTWKISLRVADWSEVNAAHLSSLYGGGGHPKSACFYIYGVNAQMPAAVEEGTTLLRGTVRDYFVPEHGSST